MKTHHMTETRVRAGERRLSKSTGQILSEVSDPDGLNIFYSVYKRDVTLQSGSLTAC